ncbi:MAG: methylmalonyl-CoA mutase [Elusimicrobia bacterium]|nr:methylmalonyl-CoA mutase [Elusimicrobiota bacterium]MDE2236285.1 methylmalonyl-CoA mutase [Elusimicrobiota bacterium]MDE2424728.1 methylmalonyl-CoA mutase [Elusimicrobiota bacterium]
MSGEEERFKTSSGIEVGRYYGPDTVPAADPGEPGSFPFTRGVQKTMYRGRLWTMRQYAGFGTAEETNRRFRWLLEQGQTGLSTAFDLPTQMGLDADDPRAAGEVGRVGVHVGTLADMETLFDSIPLEQVSTSLTINATAMVLLALYVAVAKRRGVALEQLRGTLQNDILKEFMARGTYIFPVKPSLRLAADTMEWSLGHLPRFNPISISGYHIREAGSDAVQELAFTFGDAEAYLKELLSRGLAIDEIGPRLAFFFGCHNHFLEEIAKFRAARRVWARIMRDGFGARQPRSQTLRFHVQTCGSTLTSQQPRNNVIRVALQAMAAVLGGAQSLHTNAFDEALALPSEESARLALRTQQILACETGVADTVDPVGGAYAIESLTDELERRVEEKLSRIRAEGGMVGLIERGLPQAEIQEKAYEHARGVESGRRVVVGVNAFALEDGAGGAAASLRVSPELEARQLERLKDFKASRDGRAARSALDALAEAAGSKENLFPLVLRCVEKAATLGEICAVLRKRFGGYGG